MNLNFTISHVLEKKGLDRLTTKWSYKFLAYIYRNKNTNIYLMLKSTYYICYSINIALFLGKEEIALVIDTAAGSDPPFNKGNFKIINMISCIHNCITLYFVDPAIYKWLHKFFYFYGSTHSWHDSHLIKPGCFRTSHPHKSIIIQFLIFFKALFKNCWLSIHTHITSSSS